MFYLFFPDADGVAPMVMTLVCLNRCLLNPDILIMFFYVSFELLYNSGHSMNF